MLLNQNMYNRQEPPAKGNQGRYQHTEARGSIPYLPLPPALMCPLSPCLGVDVLDRSVFFIEE